MRKRALVFVVLAIPGLFGVSHADDPLLCVEDPPRQTADPLSPPCIPTHGGNSGASWPGVTGQEVRVVLYNDLGVSGDMNAPWSPDDEDPDHLADAQARYLVRTIKAQLRYFKKHFQTYGREVRVFALPSSGGLTTPPEVRQGDALATLEYDPFAVVVAVGGGNMDAYFETLANAQRMSFGTLFDVPRATYEDNSPYIWSLMPSQETEARWSASFICRKLKGLPARFTDDPELRGRTRSFGLIYPSDSERGPETMQLAKLLRRYVDDECGMTFDQVATHKPTLLGDSNTLPIIMKRFKDEKITTVVCYCIPVQTEVTVTKVQSVATALNYEPEWYWDHASAMDRSVWQRTFGSKLGQKSFGVSYFWRQTAFPNQYHYQAYLEEEPGTRPNERFNFTIYHALLTMFIAFQLGGGDLTPATVQTGLSGFGRRDLDDPFTPTGGYDAGGPEGNTFIDTAMAWWWDPTGTPPSDEACSPFCVPTGNEIGCIRAVGGGVRSYAEGWPAGDADLFAPTDPCTTDVYRSSPVGL